MKHPIWRSQQTIFYLAAGFLYGSVLLRLVLLLQEGRVSGVLLGFLSAWLILFLTEAPASRFWDRYFFVYLVVQSILVSRMTYHIGDEGTDFFAALFAILCMQACFHLSPRGATTAMGLMSLPMALVFWLSYGLLTGSAYTLLYTGANILVTSYSLAARRAVEVQEHNRRLAEELQTANQQLRASSARLEKLATVRERSRLARELHDSVTQTVFSMNLATQSAALLFQRTQGATQPDGFQPVSEQLERIGVLAKSALAELKQLAPQIGVQTAMSVNSPAEANPAVGEGQGLRGDGGLVEALRRHLAGPTVPGDFQVAVEVSGDGSISNDEALVLFRIAQEALNNAIKHAQTDHACIQLHLAKPYWMKVEDEGTGFDLSKAQKSGGFGLAGMRERAAEIRWELHMRSSPGAGTCIEVMRNDPEAPV